MLRKQILAEYDDTEKRYNNWLFDLQTEENRQFHMDRELRELNSKIKQDRSRLEKDINKFEDEKHSLLVQVHQQKEKISKTSNILTDARKRLDEGNTEEFRRSMKKATKILESTAQESDLDSCTP